MDELDDFAKKFGLKIPEPAAPEPPKQRILAPKEDDKAFRGFFEGKGFKVNRTFGKAINQGSLHPYGLAADISIHGKTDDEIGDLVESALQRGYRLFDERVPKKGVKQTGPHLHFEGNNGNKPSEFLDGRYGKRDLIRLRELDDVRLGRSSQKKPEEFSLSPEEQAIFDEIYNQANTPDAPQTSPLAVNPNKDIVKEVLPGYQEIPVESRYDQPTRSYTRRDVSKLPNGAKYYEFEKTGKVDDFSYLGQSDGRHFFKDVNGDEYSLGDDGKIKPETQFPSTIELKDGGKLARLSDPSRYNDERGDVWKASGDKFSNESEGTRSQIEELKALGEASAKGEARSWGDADTQVAYSKWLKERGYKDEPASIQAFNDERKAQAKADAENEFRSQKGYDDYLRFVQENKLDDKEFEQSTIDAYNEDIKKRTNLANPTPSDVQRAERIAKLRNPAQTPANANKGAETGFNNSLTTFDIPTPKGITGSAKQYYMGELASRVAKWAGVGEDVAYDYLVDPKGGGSLGQATESDFIASLESGRPLSVDIDEAARRELQKIQENKAKSNAELESIRGELRGLGETDENLVEIGSLRAQLQNAYDESKGQDPERDIALLKAIDRLDAAKIKYEADLKSEDILIDRATRPREQSAPLDLEGVTGARFGINSQVGRTSPTTVTPDVNTIKEEVYGKYGSFLKKYQEEERIKQEYGTLTDSTRPMARPSEFILNFAREFIKLPGQASNLIGMGVDAMSVAGVNPKDNPFIQFGEGWKDKIDKTKNPDLKDELIVGDVAQGLAQLAQQAILTPFTGGASMLVPIGQAMEGQYIESAKAGESRNARVWAGIVGGMAAVPDALLQMRFLKNLNPLAKADFIDNLTKNLYTGLAKSLSKNEARQATIAFVGKLGLESGLGAAGENIEERTEDMINKVNKKLTQESGKNMTWGDVFKTTAREEQGYTAASIVGALGGGGRAGTDIANSRRRAANIMVEGGKSMPTPKSAMAAVMNAQEQFDQAYIKFAEATDAYEKSRKEKTQDARRSARNKAGEIFQQGLVEFEKAVELYGDAQQEAGFDRSTEIFRAPSIESVLARKGRDGKERKSALPQEIPNEKTETEVPKVQPPVGKATLEKDKLSEDKTEVSEKVGKSKDTPDVAFDDYSGSKSHAQKVMKVLPNIVGDHRIVKVTPFTSMDATNWSVTYRRGEGQDATDQSIPIAKEDLEGKSQDEITEIVLSRVNARTWGGGSFTADDLKGVGDAVPNPDEVFKKWDESAERAKDVERRRAEKAKARAGVETKPITPVEKKGDKEVYFGEKDIPKKDDILTQEKAPKRESPEQDPVKPPMTKVEKPLQKVTTKDEGGNIPSQKPKEPMKGGKLIDEGDALLERFKKVKERLSGYEKADFIEKYKAGEISTVEHAEEWESKLAKRKEKAENATSVKEYMRPIPSAIPNEGGGFDQDGDKYEDTAFAAKYIDNAITKALERGDTDTAKVRIQLMQTYPLISDSVLNAVDQVFENRQRKQAEGTEPVKPPKAEKPVGKEAVKEAIGKVRPTDWREVTERTPELDKLAERENAKAERAAKKATENQYKIRPNANGYTDAQKKEYAKYQAVIDTARATQDALKRYSKLPQPPQEVASKEEGDVAKPPQKAKSVEEQKKPYEATKATAYDHDGIAEAKTNNITKPTPNKYKEGDIAIDRLGDPYVYRLEYVDPNDTEYAELSDDEESVRKMPTTQKYAEWYKEGIEPEPITLVYNQPKKKHHSTNRRRIVAARMAGVKRIPAWVEVGKHREVIAQALASGELTPERAKELGHFEAYPELAETNPVEKAEAVSDDQIGGLTSRIYQSKGEHVRLSDLSEAERQVISSRPELFDVRKVSVRLTREGHWFDESFNRKESDKKATKPKQTKPVEKADKATLKKRYDDLGDQIGAIRRSLVFRDFVESGRYKDYLAESLPDWFPAEVKEHNRLYKERDAIATQLNAISDKEKPKQTKPVEKAERKSVVEVGKPHTSKTGRTTIRTEVRIGRSDTNEKWADLDHDKVSATVTAAGNNIAPKRSESVWAVEDGKGKVVANGLTYKDAIEQAKAFVESADIQESDSASRTDSKFSPQDSPYVQYTFGEETKEGFVTGTEGKYVFIEDAEGKVDKVLEGNVKKEQEFAKSAIDQPDTKEFKNWFGDSKVVDENGKPLIVYRGDKFDDFDTFDRNKTNEQGFFFTPNKKIASIYAHGKEPRSFYLQADKILDLTRDDIPTRKWIASWAESFDDWTDRQSGEEVDAADVLFSGRMFDFEGDWSQERWRDLQSTAEYEGYDAVILPDGDNDGSIFPSYVVFRPTQIKSVFNKGTFDPNNPDIAKRSRDNQEFAKSAIDQTDTKEFKNWFGDSKVVDEDGKPLMVYHGTTKDVPAFRSTKGSHFGFHFGTLQAAHERLEDTAGRSVRLTDDLNRIDAKKDAILKERDALASEITRRVQLPQDYQERLLKALQEGNSSEVTRLLNLQRGSPTEAETARLSELDAEFKALTAATLSGIRETTEGANIIPVYLRITKPLRAKDALNWGSPKAVSEATGFSGRTLKEIKEKIQEAGYDGIVYQNAVESSILKEDSYIAFEPTQIKSVFNKGTFDPNNPDIAKRSREEIEAFGESFKNVRFESNEDVLANYKPESIVNEGDGIIGIEDVYEYETLRRLLVMLGENKNTFWLASILEPNHTDRLLDALEGVRKEFKSKALLDLKKKLLKAKNERNGHIILILDEGAMPEERFQRALNENRIDNRAKQIPQDVLREISDSPEFQKALNNQFGRNYKNETLPMKVEEFVAKIVTNQFDELGFDENDIDKARELVIKFIWGFKEANGEQALENLASEIAYVQEIQEQVRQFQKEPKRDRQESKADRTPRPERSQVDGESEADFVPSGKVKESQTPKSLRGKADIEVGDRTYVGVTNPAQQEFADNQLDKGTDKAQEWFDSQVDDNNLNSGATAVVGLNLLNHYAKTRQISKLNQVADKLVPFITEVAQTLQAMSIVSSFDPARAAAYAAKIKKQRRNKPLTEDEARRAEEIAIKLNETAQADAIADKAIEEAEQLVRELTQEQDALKSELDAVRNENKKIKVDLTEAKKAIKKLRAELDKKPRTAKAKLIKELTETRAERMARIQAKYGEFAKSVYTYDDFEIEILDDLDNNASGDSSASIEAINRLQQEKNQRTQRVVMDTRSGRERPLIGVDAVDYNPRPYERVLFRGGLRDGEVIQYETAKSVAPTQIDDDIIDEATLILAEGINEMSVEQFKTVINTITNNAFSPEQINEIHAEAVENIKANRKPSDEQKAALKNRNAHYRDAQKHWLGMAQKAMKPAKADRLAESIARVGVENGYSDEAILFAMARKNKAKLEDATKAFKEEYPDITPREMRKVMEDADRLITDAKTFIKDRAIQVKNQFSLTQSEIESLKQEKKDNEKAARAVRAEADRFYKGLSQTGWQVAADTVVNLRKANLLTGIKTHLRNLTGNVAFGASEEVSRVIGWMADVAMSGYTGERTTDIINPISIGRALKNIVKVDDTLKNAGKDSGVQRALQILKYGSTFAELEKQQHLESAIEEKFENAKARKAAKWMDAYINGVFRTLGAEDALFKVYAFRRSLEEQARTRAITEKRSDKSVNVKERTKELTLNPSNEMIAIADQFADFMTFQNENKISETFGKVKRISPAIRIPSEIVVPYDRTPTNIFLRALEYTPAGFAKAAKKAYDMKQSPSDAFRAKMRSPITQDLMTKDDFNALPQKEQRKIVDAAMQKVWSREQQREFAKTFGRAGTGSALFTMGFFMAAAGLLTGSLDGGDDEERDKFFERKKIGVENRSLLIPRVGRFVLPDDPAMKILTAGATLYEQLEMNRGDKALGAWNAVKETTGDIIFEQPYMRSTLDLYRTARRGSYGQFAGNVAGGYVPTLISDVGEVLDTKPRTTSGSVVGLDRKTFTRELQFQGRGARNSFFRRVPILREYMVPESTGSVSDEERGGILRRAVRMVDLFNTRSPQPYSMSRLGLIGSPHLKRMTTDEVVSVIEFDLTSEDVPSLKSVLKDKAINARKAGTLTQEEVDRIKSIMPEFKITPRVKKK